MRIIIHKDKIKDFFDYLLIVLLYYTTGGAFSYANYNTKIIALFICLLPLCLLYNKRSFLMRKVLLILTIMSSLIVIIPLIFNDSISTYLAIILQLGIGALCASFIDKHEFVRKYVNIIVFFASASLLFFIIGKIMPSIIYFFPFTRGEGSVDYYNAIIYVFMTAKGFSNLVMSTRNAGICWEPGCYQCFLNIALFFLLDNREMFIKKNYYIRMLILVITILTTQSTTGVLILIILLIAYFKQLIVGLGRKVIIFPIILVALFFFLGKSGLIGTITAKVSGEFIYSSSFLDRISLYQIKYIVSNGVFYFFGMSFSKFITYNQDLWNSIIHSFLCLGIPFTLIHLVGYWKGSNVLSRRKGYVLFVLMIMSASTETLFWRVFFNTIAFYGWINDNNKNKNRNLLSGKDKV